MSDDIAKVLRKLEYGVYVVTMGKGQDGNAFTASWLTQTSSEPPMIALAVHNAHQSAPMIKKFKAFAVNLIAEGQESTAKTYYGPAESGYQKLEGYDDITDSPATKSPLIPGAVGYLDCTLHEAITTGNHTLFIGKIEAAEYESDDPILTSSNSKLRYTG